MQDCLAAGFSLGGFAKDVWQAHSIPGTGLVPVFHGDSAISSKDRSMHRMISYQFDARMQLEPAREWCQPDG